MPGFHGPVVSRDSPGPGVPCRRRTGCCQVAWHWGVVVHVLVPSVRETANSGPSRTFTGTCSPPGGNAVGRYAFGVDFGLRSRSALAHCPIWCGPPAGGSAEGVPMRHPARIVVLVVVLVRVIVRASALEHEHDVERRRFPRRLPLEFRLQPVFWPRGGTCCRAGGRSASGSDFLE